MFAPGVCGELGNPRCTGASETEKLAETDPVHRHPRDIAIQMWIVFYLEGEIVSFIIQGNNKFTLLDFLLAV